MMSKLIFRYGAMGSSKSASALMLYHNFKERGKTVFLFKPECDTRDGKFVKSSCGLQQEAIPFLQILGVVYKQHTDLVIVDEAQFLTKGSCEILVHLVDKQEINVVCYGLRTDFRGELFEGSKYLLAHADKIEELKTICHCGNKCTHNLRVDHKGNPVADGEQIELGNVGSNYTALCRYHFNEAYGRGTWNLPM